MTLSPEEREQVREFLEECRLCKDVLGFYILWSRPKNKQFLESSGITEEEAQEILLNKLSTKHYCKGPSPEKDDAHQDGTIYEFKYKWKEGGLKIYIKLKLVTGGLHPTCICLSFHD